MKLLIPYLLVGILMALDTGPTIANRFKVGDGELSRITAVSMDSLTSGILSNVIAEVVIQSDSLVWIGTGNGLSVLRDSTTAGSFSTGSEFTEVGSTDELPIGGISAIAAANETLFVATATTSDNNNPMGNGFVYSENSTDSSVTWTYFSQPTETAADSLRPFAKRFFKALPVTTSEFNVTYDASIAGDYIWIASWAGGLRRRDIEKNTWERVPIPLDSQTELNTCDTTLYEKDDEGQKILKDYYLNPRDPEYGGNHNHKAFSVLAYKDTIWVGTADGINRGIIGENGCVNWKHYSYPLDNLTGNFTVSLARQDWNGLRIIWAATVNADDPSESRGLSYTTNDGGSWSTTLNDVRVYNVTAHDSLVFAATNEGLWKSEDGQTWARFKGIKQAVQTGTVYDLDEILSDEIFSAAFDSRGYYPSNTLWIGTMDGLARSYDLDGTNWRIYRSEYDSDLVYVYPNPFSPNVHNILDGDGYVHFHTDVTQSFVVKMAVYNFAMERVYSTEYDRRKSSGALKWNGKDSRGNLVANGTYFIKLDYDEKSEWVKLIVVK